MACPSITLAVITLLQLSRAEISDKQPKSWYSANVISDGFQPKPISELFSTEPSLSSTSPIMVAPESNALPEEILLLSTLTSPSRKLSNITSTSGAFTKVTVPPFTESTPLPSTVRHQSASESLSELPPQNQIQPQPQQTEPPELQTQYQTRPELQSVPQPTLPLLIQPLPQQQPDLKLQPLQEQPESQLQSKLQQPEPQIQSLSDQQPAPENQPVPQQQPEPQKQPSSLQQLEPNIQPLPQQQPEPQIEPSPQQQPDSQKQPSPQEQPESELQPSPQEQRPQIISLPQLQPIEADVQSEAQRTTQSVQILTEVQTTQPQTQQTQSQQIPFVLVPQQAPIQPLVLPQVPQLPQIILPQLNITQTSTTSPQSNYFLIYQQAPQSIQGYPQQNQQPSISASPVPQTVFTRRQIVPTSPQPNTVISPQQTRLFPPGLNVQSTPPTRFTNARIRTTPSGRLNANFDRNNTQPSVTTPIPGALPLVPPSSGMFPIKIRVVAPSGSITNVRFNPTSTTKRPTTTRTRRTNRPKKNRYDICIDACKGRRDPICGAPLSANPVDPNTLKGFPSVCHMACHNSYRRQPYEKLIDGRCGRLRTRIRPVDSNSKLKRDELNKAQYFIDNTAPNTVVEFSGALNLP